VLVVAALASRGGQKAKPEKPPIEEKPAAPSLKLGYKAVKIFEFSWADVKGEAGYKLLEDESGSGSFQEVASIPADATSCNFEALLPGKVNARYKLEACNDAGCSKSAAVSFRRGSAGEGGGVFQGVKHGDA